MGVETGLQGPGGGAALPWGAQAGFTEEEKQWAWAQPAPSARVSFLALAPRGCTSLPLQSLGGRRG